MKPEVAALIRQHVSMVGALVAERVRKVPAHVNRDDLTSAGMMALVLSACAYDPTRGVPFTLFAAFRIRGALLDELRAMDWASRSVRSLARDIDTIRADLTVALDRSPASADIAAALGISTRELDAAYADLARGAVRSVQEFAPDTLPAASGSRTDCPESLILQREQLGYLHDAIAALPERLRFVVIAYFFEEREMSEIAVGLSVTQSRVSQLCSEATKLIRDGMNSQLNPGALPPPAQSGRAAIMRAAYYRALAARNTVVGRLAITTPDGEMRPCVYTEHARKPQRVKIA